MLKAGRNLQTTYGSVFHITCTVHGLNRVAEEIRSTFKSVDGLIAAMKASFRKAPARVLKYKELFPNLELPPQPVITRWGTWLKAAEFYAKNLEELKIVMEALKPDSAAVQTAKELIVKPKLSAELAFLQANYTFLAEVMENMQKQGLSLNQSLKYFRDAGDKISKVDGTKGENIAAKFLSIYLKNPDLQKLEIISKIIDGNEVAEEDLNCIKLSPDSIAAFKFAPITTVDNERSFSMHKALLSDRRRKTTPEHLEMALVGHFEL